MNDPSIDASEHLDNVASFSPDMALGTMLYLVATSDKARAERWFAWLDAHRPCWSGSEPECAGSDLIFGISKNIRGPTRYCTDEPGPEQPGETELDKALRKLRIDPRCTLRPGDLATLGRVRAFLKAYKFDTAASQACNEPSPAGEQEMKQRLEKLERLLNITRLENIRALVGGGLPYALSLACADADSWIRTGAEFNQPGFSQHLVAASIYLLRRANQDSPMLQEASVRLAAKQPENPFFLFLKNGKKQIVLDKILQHCPKTAEEAKLSKQSEWLWERQQTDANWKNTSTMWDCLFVGTIWTRGY